MVNEENNIDTKLGDLNFIGSVGITQNLMFELEIQE